MILPKRNTQKKMKLKKKAGAKEQVTKNVLIDNETEMKIDYSFDKDIDKKKLKQMIDVVLEDTLVSIPKQFRSKIDWKGFLGSYNSSGIEAIFEIESNKLKFNMMCKNYVICKGFKIFGGWKEICKKVTRVIDISLRDFVNARQRPTDSYTIRNKQPLYFTKKVNEHKSLSDLKNLRQLKTMKYLPLNLEEILNKYLWNECSFFENDVKSVCDEGDENCNNEFLKIKNEQSNFNYDQDDFEKYEKIYQKNPTVLKRPLHSSKYLKLKDPGIEEQKD